LAVYFGLKGRFYQPRPKAWETGSPRAAALKGPFMRGARHAERPFQGRIAFSSKTQAFGLGW
jgi:hypothetical protein